MFKRDALGDFFAVIPWLLWLLCWAASRAASRDEGASSPPHHELRPAGGALRCVTSTIMVETSGGRGGAPGTFLAGAWLLQQCGGKVAVRRCLFTG